MPLSELIALRKIKLALSILQLNMLYNRSKDHEAVFQSAWALSKRLDFLLSAFSCAGNPRGYQVHQVVYLRLLRLLHRIKPGYVPNVTVINEHVLTDLARSEVPAIIATIHSPVDVILHRILQERGIRSSLLAANHATVAEKARVLGCEQQPDFIANSENTLLQFRRKLRQNKSVHLCVDYSDNSSGINELFISSATFRLAGTMTANVIFSDACVTRAGHIELHLQAYNVARTPDPDDIADAFLRWLKQVRGHDRTWTITSTGRGR